MTKSRKRRRRNRSQRYETAGALVIGRAQVRRVSSSVRASVRRSRTLLAVLLLVAAAGALWLWLDARFYVYGADVDGAVRTSSERIFQASGLSGLHVLWVRSADVEGRILEAVPGIESARVICRLPARCTIAVVERQPRVTWDEDGRMWWIDGEGVVFPAVVTGESVAEGSAPGGLLVRGQMPRDEEGRLDERVRVGLAELWAAGGSVPPELAYVPGRGLMFNDERGWRVIVGQGPGMERRLEVLDWLVADLQTRGLTPRFVDVRFAEVPYYSLTNDW